MKYKDKDATDDLYGKIKEYIVELNGDKNDESRQEIAERLILILNEVQTLEDLAERKGYSVAIAGWVHRPDGSVVVSGAEPLSAIRGFLEGSPDIKRRQGLKCNKKPSPNTKHG